MADNNYISKMREMYPMYDKVDDTTLAKAFRKKHYPDLDETEFLKKVNLYKGPIDNNDSWGDKISSFFSNDKDKNVVDNNINKPLTYKEKFEAGKLHYRDTTPNDWGEKINGDIIRPFANTNRDNNTTVEPKKDKPLTYKEKFEAGKLHYRDTTPNDWGKKITKDATALKEQYVEPVLFGSGEDFKSKEFNFNDEVIEPFKVSSRNVAKNDIMSDAIIAIGDDANDPKKLKEFIDKRDKLNQLDPMAHLQKKVSNMKVKENTAKHTPKTVIEAFKKKGALSLDSWSELFKTIPSVTAGSLPNTASFIVDLPQAIKGYGYQIAKDSLTQDGITREPTKKEYAKSLAVATVIGTLDRWGFSKSAEPLRDAIARAIVENPKDKVLDTIKSFSKTTIHGIKHELPTELAQENLETSYIKDKDLTGKDLLEASVGAFLGTVGMTTGIATATEIANATTNTKQGVIDNAFKDFSKDINQYDIDTASMNKRISQSFNPNNAMYKIASQQLPTIIDNIKNNPTTNSDDTLYTQESDDYKKLKEQKLLTYDNIEENNPELAEAQLTDDEKVQVSISFEELFKEEIEQEEQDTLQRVEFLNNTNDLEKIKQHPLYDTIIGLAKNKSYDKTGNNKSEFEVSGKGGFHNPDGIANENTIRWGTTFKENYGRHFLLSDKAVQRIENGKATDGDIDKLKKDLIRFDTDPTWYDDKLAILGGDVLFENNEATTKDEEISTTKEIDNALDGFKQLENELFSDDTQNDTQTTNIQNNTQDDTQIEDKKTFTGESLENVEPDNTDITNKEIEELTQDEDTNKEPDYYNDDISNEFQDEDFGGGFKNADIGEDGLTQEELDELMQDDDNTQEDTPQEQEPKLTQEEIKELTEDKNDNKDIDFLIGKIKEHKDYNSKYLNNKDEYTKKLALQTMVNNIMSKNRKDNIELYKKYVSDNDFKSNIIDTLNSKLSKEPKLTQEEIKELTQNDTPQTEDNQLTEEDSKSSQALEELKKNDLESLKREKIFNSEDFQESLINHNKIFKDNIKDKDISYTIEDYINITSESAEDWQIPTLDKTTLDLTDIKDYAKNDFDISKVEKNKKQYKFIPERITSYGKPKKGYVINKDMYGFEINDMVIDMGVDMSVEKGWDFIHLYPKTTSFNSGEYIPKSIEIAKANNIEIKLNDNKKIKELFEDFNSVYEKLTKKEIEDIKNIEDIKDREIASTELIRKKLENNDIIEHKEKKGDIDNDKTGATRTNRDVSNNDTNTDGGEQSNGSKTDDKKEDSTKVSNKQSDSNGGRDGNNNQTRGKQDGSKGDSDSTTTTRVKEQQDNFSLNQDEAYQTGKVGRFNSNIEAIKLINDTTKKKYTQDEKKILSSYTGWGGIQEVFGNTDGTFKDGWYERSRLLKDITTSDDYNSMQRGVLNAYYTPLEIVKTMWELSQYLGFKGGKVLEPSMGTGRFIGLTPTNLKQNTSFTGVELDPTTYKIAKALYPNINGRNKGFEKTSYKENTNLVIGNPPYGENKVYDKNNKEYNSLAIHNYFIVKSLDALSSKGILNFVISSSFLDNLKPKTVELINRKAKLIGAIRLPDNVFPGTKVTTDIVIFQKLQDGEKGNKEVWSEKSSLNGFKINKYFVDNPNLLLGKWEKGYRNNGTLKDDGNFKENLEKAILYNIHHDVMGDYKNISISDNVDGNININPTIIYEKDGKVFVNIKDADSLKQVNINVNIDKAKAFFDLRDSLSKLISLEKNKEIKDIDIEKQRATLNKNYEKFTKKYGLLNRVTNKSFISKDKTGYAVLSLEENYKPEIKVGNKKGLTPQKESFKKADILSKRVINPKNEIYTDNSKEALLFSISSKGGVDFEYMSKITKKSKDVLLKELDGDIFYDNNVGYVTKDIFLSGDIKEKLSNTTDEKAIKELTKALPKDIEAKDIDVGFGQSWIDLDYVQQYMKNELGFNGSVYQSLATSKWVVMGNSYTFQFSADGIKDKDLIESALNNKPIKITKKLDGKTYLDESATTFANAQVDNLKEHFKGWIFRDKDRKKDLVKKYNDTFNRYNEMDSEVLIKGYSIPNLEHYTPRYHQKKAVYRAVFENTPLLLNHTVGSGKTLTSQMIAMEWKRLGKANKPLIATLKSVVPQYAKEFKEAYPSANILVATEKDFSKERRKIFLSSIATGDYDAIVISHNQLKALKNPNDIEEQIISDEIEMLEEAIREASDNNSEAGKRTLRDLENKKNALETKISSLQDIKKDDILNFDDLGIDGIIVDESHIAKKLIYSSSMGDIKGMPDTKGSDIAFDLYVKTQHILQNNNSKNVVFMTGTPITNTIPELYLIQKFLQEDTLREQGLFNFDSWASNYVNPTTDIEISADGKFKEVTRIKEFKNMDTLIQTTNLIMDTVTNNDIIKSDKGFKLPHLKNNKPTLVFNEPTPEQIEYNKELVERVANLSPKSKDNHLVIFNDASSMSVDMRLVSLTYSDAKNSKINKVVDNFIKKYKEFDSVKGTQLIFSDKGVPNNNGKFSVYDDIKLKLIEKGIPENEIAIIHDFETKEKKIELSKKVNSGEVRLVIGSTQKLGTGMNVQERITAVHHIDIPYTPAELEQRNGRIIRQGNKLIDDIDNFEVEIFYYATKNTLDGVKWQILENKSKFIQQFYEGNVDKDLEVSDMSNSELAEIMKAEASGNPLLLERMRLDKRKKKLQALKRNFELGKDDLKEKIEDTTNFLKNIDKVILDLEADTSEILEEDILIGGKKYDKVSKLGEAIYDKVSKLAKNKSREELEIGNIGYIKIIAKYNSAFDTMDISIKGKTTQDLTYYFSSQSIKGLGTKFKNKLKDFNIELDNKIEQKDIAINDLPRLKEQQKDDKFDKEDELQEVLEKFQDVIDKISSQAKGKKSDTPDMEDTDDIESFNSELPTSNEKEIDKKIDKEIDKRLNQRNIDTAGDNYIAPYSVDGYPIRPISNTINIDGKDIKLPKFTEPTTVETLRLLLKDIIGNRLYEKKIKGKATLGTYNRKNTSIRVKNYDDIETQAHEMAHFLDYFYKNSSNEAKDSFFKDFKNKHKDILKSVSYTNKKDKAIPEGFAEFVRLYITQYNKLTQLDNQAVKDFENTIKKDKELFNKIIDYRDEAHKYFYQGVDARATAMHDNRVSKKAQNVKDNLVDSKSKKRQSLIDLNHGVKLAEADLLGDTHHDGKDSPYKLFQLIKGAGGTIDMTLEYGIPKIDENGDITLDESKKSLDEIFKPIFNAGKEEIINLENYFMAKRSSELIEQGRENKLNEDDIEQLLKLEDRYPHFKDIFNDYQEFNDNMLDFYVEMNLITSEQKDNFQEFNKNYVPFNRIKESLETGVIKGNVATSRLGTRLKGGTSTLNGIMENIYNNVERNIKDAFIARAKSKLFDMINKNKGGNYAVKVSPDTKKVKSDIETQALSVANVLAQLGVTVAKDGMLVSDGFGKFEGSVVDVNEIKDILIENPQLLEFWTFGHKPKSMTGLIDSAIIDDKRVYFEVIDPLLADTLTSQGGIQLDDGLIGKGLKLAILFKNIHTSLITNNPLFYLTNALRDTVSAGVLSKGNFIPFVDTIKGMYSFIKRDKLYKEFMVAGGGYSNRRTALGNYDDLATKETTIQLGYTQKIFKAIAYGADLFENGTRIGEFGISKKQGKSNIEGAFRGREISTDFSVRGSDKGVATLLSTISFAKAGVNSIDKLVRRIFSIDGKIKGKNAFKFRNSKGEFLKHKRNFYLAGATIASLSVLLFSNNKDDERYKRLTKDQKSMNWYIYLDHYISKDILKSNNIHPIIKIPKPYDIGTIFASTPELISEYLYSKVNKKYKVDNQELLDRFYFSLANMGGILNIPTFLKGTFEIYKNEDWRGVPIESVSMQNIEKKYRARDNTNKLYKELGNNVLSPVQIEHLVNSTLGLYGRMINDGLEAMLWDEKTQGKRAFSSNVIEYLTSRVRGKDVESRTKYDDYFYDIYEKSIKANATYNNFKNSALRDNNKIEDYKKFVKDKKTQKLIGLKSRVTSIHKKLQAISKNIKDMKISTKYKTKKDKEIAINSMLEKKHNFLKKQVEIIKKILKEDK